MEVDDGSHENVKSHLWFRWAWRGIEGFKLRREDKVLKK